MDLVKMIMDLLSGSGLQEKLSSLLGESDKKTESAVGAAVPAILAGLSGLASSKAGGEKLATTLGTLGPKTLANMGTMIQGQPAAVAEQGTSMLSSLFGGSDSQGIISTLSRFTGLAGPATKNLLGFLTPGILGVIYKQFEGKSITPQSVSNLFADQKANIANALPSGLSLNEVAKMATAGTTAPATPSYGAATPTYKPAQATSSAWKWLLPLLGLLVLGGLLYYLMPRSNPTPAVTEPTRDMTVRSAVPALPAMPSVARVKEDVLGITSTLTKTLTGITDAATAKTAMPMLTEVNTRLDAVTELWNKLPEAGRMAVGTAMKPALGSLRDMSTKVLGIAGLDEQFKPLLDQIMAKLTSLAG